MSGRNILHPSSGLKEAICFSEMLASTDKSTWHQNPDHHHNFLKYFAVNFIMVKL
jgi:hypothetical protein